MKKLLFILLTTTVSALYGQYPTLDWAVSFGAGGNDVAHGIFIDGNNTYSSGIFASTTDFDPGTGTHNLKASGVSDGFISKFSNDGLFIWAISIGGQGADAFYDVASDGNGDVVATGLFSLTADFDPGSSNHDLTSKGFSDAFIAKYDKNGNLKWVNQIGGIKEDAGKKVLIDGNNNIYVTGYFEDSIDFDPSVNQAILYCPGASNTFIAKYDPIGNFIWAKQFDGGDFIIPEDMCLDPSGNLLMTGSFRGQADFNPGVNIKSLTSNGGEDIFICKLNDKGAFVWALSFGADYQDFGYGIGTDATGQIYCTGSFKGTVDFDPSGNIYEMTVKGGIGSHQISDAYVLKLTNNGDFVWAGSMGGSEKDIGSAIAVDDSGTSYVTGTFKFFGDFDPGPGTFTLPGIDYEDMFLTKITKDGELDWAAAFSGKFGDFSKDVFIEGNNVLMTGSFQETIDLHPGRDSVVYTSNGYADAFILKIKPGPLGIDAQEQNDFQLYPNPSSGQVTIELDNTYNDIELNVYSIEGRLIDTIRYTNTNKIDFWLDAVKGLYFIELRYGRQVKVARIIKK